MSRSKLKDLAMVLWWGPGLRVMHCLPQAALRALYVTAGFCLERLLVKKRRELEAMVVRLLGPATPQSVKKTAVREALACTIGNDVDLMRLPCLGRTTINRDIPCEGLHHLDEALKMGRGALLLHAHYASFKAVMPAIGHRGYELHQMLTPPSIWREVLQPHGLSPAMERAIKVRLKLEESLPIHDIDATGPLREAFRCLESNGVLAVAMDGNLGSPTTLPFLNSTLNALAGGVRIALRCGSPILPTFATRDHAWRNRVIIHPPLHATGPNAPELLLQQFLRLLEGYVRERPGFYIGFCATKEKSPPPRKGAQSLRHSPAARDATATPSYGGEDETSSGHHNPFILNGLTHGRRRGRRKNA